MGRYRARGLASAAVLLLAGCAGALPVPATGQDATAAGLPPLADAVPTPPLQWEPCTAPPSPMSQCADMVVPLDYRDPAGRTLTVRVSRVPARDPARRRGVLVTNPGGPGAVALHNALGVDGLVGGALADRYDLVGFDPRGVGGSSPISCRLTPEQVARASVDDALVAFADDVETARATARSCAEHAGDVLPHVTTPNLARDMDLLRRALGEDRLTYYGTSGGTTLGTTYAALFPQHVDRMVLDSVDDDTVSRQQAFRAGDAAVDARFDQVSRALAADDARWGLGTDPAAIRDRYLGQLDRLAGEVVEFDGVRAEPGALRGLALSALRRDADVPLFADVLRFLSGVEGAPTEAELARRLGPLPSPEDEVRASREAERVTTAFLAITCADDGWSRDPEDYRRAVVADAAAFPVSAGARAAITACAFWPAPSAPPEPRPILTDRGRDAPPNILLLQNAFDPATPLAGARHTREALGTRAIMITTSRGGHGVLGVDLCATDAAREWLVDGDLPAADRRCGP